MTKQKLKWNIFAYIIMFCALLLVILWLSQTVFLTEMYKAVRKVEINRAVSYVKKHVESPDLENILSELLVSKDILVTQTQEFEPPPEVSRGDGNGTDHRNKNKIETIIQREEFRLSNGDIVSFTFFAMITPVSATVSTLRVQLCFITGIMLLLSVGLAFAIARRVSRPIEKMNTSAKSLATGDYDTYFDGDGFLEIRELSDTLNVAAVELSKVENLRRELLANISHDLRTPLALIYSYAEMMHDFPDEINLEQPQVIMDEATRLSTLVDDVLDVSKLESGNVALNHRIYNLTESLSATTERIGALVKKDGYHIAFLYEEEVYVQADEVKMTQVFYNLLMNAINHGGEEQCVVVHQLVQEDDVEIQVVDQGGGIREEDLPFIWDRYYKVDKVHKRARIGTGLGLYIVKRIMDKHHGSCGVATELGRGSMFWFRLKKK